MLLGLWLSLAASSALAQDLPPARTWDVPPPAALRGDAFRLESETLGHGFDIYVRLPPDYRTSGQAYPVIYLLDGDSLFPILAANHLFLHYDDGLPEAVIVGIAYGGFDPAVNRRNIDFQSPDPEVPVEQAGAETFHLFLANELIPLIERRFHVDPEQRVLFGQSRGGNLVLWSAVHSPDTFWGRIASNPSLTPGMGSILTGAAPSEHDDRMVVVTSGDRDRADLRPEARQWVETWQVTDVDERPFNAWLFEIPGGTHAANATDSYRVGMNWLFQPPQP